MPKLEVCLPVCSVTVLYQVKREQAHLASFKCPRIPQPAHPASQDKGLSSGWGERERYVYLVRLLMFDSLVSCLSALTLAVLAATSRHIFPRSAGARGFVGMATHQSTLCSSHQVAPHNHTLLPKLPLLCNCTTLLSRIRDSIHINDIRSVIKLFNKSYFSDYSRIIALKYGKKY